MRTYPERQVPVVQLQNTQHPPGAAEAMAWNPDRFGRSNSLYRKSCDFTNQVQPVSMMGRRPASAAVRAGIRS